MSVTPDTQSTAGEETQPVPQGTEVVVPSPAASRSPAGDRLPARIGRFPVQEFLGRGACGEVYLAHHPELEIPVAVKVLGTVEATSPEGVERFRREARTAARIRHQNVINVFELGQDDELQVPYIVMEYVEGTDVARLMQKHKDGMPLASALRIVTETARGLRELARCQILHRDIKPGNIMVTRDDVVKLADLGISKNLDETSLLTKSDQTIGTPAYMSPEQITDPRHMDTRSDIYSLGATFYYLVTGTNPFQARNTFEMMQKIVREMPTPPTQRNQRLPALAEETICRMMAKRPGDRFQTVDELLTGLESLAEQTVKPKTACVPDSGRSHTRTLTRSVALAGRPLRSVLALGAAWGVATAGVAAALVLLLRTVPVPVPLRVAAWLLAVGMLPWLTHALTAWAVKGKSNAASGLVLGGYVAAAVLLALALTALQATGAQLALLLPGAALVSAGYSYWACERVADRYR